MIRRPRTAARTCSASICRTTASIAAARSSGPRAPRSISRGSITGGVRLQYHRWLGVEDGYFDSASVLANGTKVWTNYASASEPAGDSKHHIDKEWRFHDIDVTNSVLDGKLKLRFELASDRGFNLGGWTLDDVCVVIAKPGPECELDDSCDDEGVLDNGCCSVGGSPEGALALSVLTAGVLFRRRRRG